jgi:hypothetical protein
MVDPVALHRIRRTRQIEQLLYLCAFDVGSCRCYEVPRNIVSRRTSGWPDCFLVNNHNEGWTETSCQFCDLKLVFRSGLACLFRVKDGLGLKP